MRGASPAACCLLRCAACPRNVFGSANLTVDSAARAAANESWAALLPDSYFIYELHDNQVRAPCCLQLWHACRAQPGWFG